MSTPVFPVQKYSIQSYLPASGEVWVNKFDEDSAFVFREQILELVSKSDKPIIVYIDSYGGCVDALTKMIDTMDSVNNKFITVAMGKAMSCGAILLSHGDIRFCTTLARTMIHRVSGVSWGDAMQQKSSTTETLRINAMMTALLAINCKKTPEEVEALIRASDGQELFMDAIESLNFGLVDHIGVPTLHAETDWTITKKPADIQRPDDQSEKPKAELVKKTTKRSKNPIKK